MAASNFGDHLVIALVCAASDAAAIGFAPSKRVSIRRPAGEIEECRERSRQSDAPIVSDDQFTR